MTQVRQAVRQHAVACAALGSALMARLMAGIADALELGTPVAARVLGWQGDRAMRAPGWKTGSRRAMKAPCT